MYDFDLKNASFQRQLGERAKIGKYCSDKTTLFLWAFSACHFYSEQPQLLKYLPDDVAIQIQVR